MPRKEVEAISKLVDNLTPADLGVEEPPSKPFRMIEYTEVFAGELVTVCIFKLPAGAQLPMHDHPHMTVWSREGLVFERCGVCDVHRDGVSWISRCMWRWYLMDGAMVYVQDAVLKTRTRS